MHCLLSCGLRKNPAGKKPLHACKLCVACRVDDMWRRAKHRSGGGLVRLGNETVRARRCRADLPVSLLASRVAWFLRARRRGVCLRGAAEDRDAPPVLLTRPGQGCRKPPCVYVCVSQCPLLQPQVVYVRLLMHSAAINVARGGKKEALHVDAFVWVFQNHLTVCLCRAGLAYARVCI